MASKIQFSILSYCPSVVANERINIGIIAHNPLTNQRTFEHVKKWSRIEAFDDEIDIEMFKIILSGIKNEVTSTMGSARQWVDIPSYTRYYTNELRFDSVREYDPGSDDILFLDAVEHLKKLYLRFDLKQSERLTQEDEKHIVRRIIKDKNFNISSSPITGPYNDGMNFDIVVNEKECIKFLRLDQRTAIHHARAFAFMCGELKERYSVTIVLLEHGNPDPATKEAVKRIITSTGGTPIGYDDYIRQVTATPQHALS